MDHLNQDVYWLLQQLGTGVLCVGGVLLLVCAVHWVDRLWSSPKEPRDRE